jgi:ApbE superfamily uncharacterized protein (UPF0280 family)
MEQPRFYREWTDSGLTGFTVRDKETDIHIAAERDLRDESLASVRRFRGDIIRYIQAHPEFETSLVPLPEDEAAPSIVKAMLDAARRTGVGPMAAVAGAVSEFVGKELLRFSSEVILENGGDIFIKTNTGRNIGIYAGDSPLSGRVAVRIRSGPSPVGVCTSSGTVGHSLSFGKADAVTVVSGNTPLADSCATAAANMVTSGKDIEKALNFAKSIESIYGAVVIYKGTMGSIGDIELVRSDT